MLRRKGEEHNILLQREVIQIHLKGAVAAAVAVAAAANGSKIPVHTTNTSDILGRI